MNMRTTGTPPVSSFDATIILPPGSTAAELQMAINGAASGDVIQLSGNINFTGAVIIPVGKEITIRSDTEANRVLTHTAANVRHFTVNGTLMLEKITLNGGNIGGGITVNGGALTTHDGTVIQNCRAAYGGGVYVFNGTFDMYEGAAIRSNTVSGDGAGVLVDEGVFNMRGGIIEYNEAPTDGGGVYVYDSTFNMYEGAVIRFNTVTGRVSEGAGVIVDAGEFYMRGGAIAQNQATGVNSFGGGVSVLESNFYMYGGEIRQNIAADGGGVSTDDSYFNMSGGFISDNTAKGGGTVTVIGVGNVGTFGGRGGGVMDNFFSTFEMTGGEIHDNRNMPGENTSGLNGFNGPSKGGGVYVYYGSSFIMGGNAKITNNTADRGGGFAAVGTSVSSNSMTMGGNAAVTDNHAEYGGGACFLVGHTSYVTYAGSNSLTMSDDASIDGNTADKNGGGVYMYSVNITPANTGNRLDMGGRSSISGNTAGQDGGAVYMNMVVYGTAGNILSLSESAAIAYNTAGENGGGVYLSSLAVLQITGASVITYNSASNGNGGGINTEDLSYHNLTTGGATVFGGNTAIGAYAPPPDAAEVYPNIQFASTSITDHPLNNYDINYISGVPLAFHVTYDANGGIGSYIGPEIFPSGTYMVLSPEETGINREGYAFTGWNVQPNGGGASFMPGDVIVLNSNVTLYAQWMAAIPPSPPSPPAPPSHMPRCRPLCRLRRMPYSASCRRK